MADVGLKRKKTARTKVFYVKLTKMIQIRKKETKKLLNLA